MVAYPPFRPRFPWIGAHLQTVRNTLVDPACPLPAGMACHFPMADGTGDALIGLLNRPSRDAGRPLALLIHGLTGTADSYYVAATAAMLLAEGHAVLRLNLRGAGPSAGRCRQRYHAGRTQDLRAVLAQLPADLVGDGVIVIGWSLGGNVVLKLLGEADFPVPVRAGAAISAPIDLAAACRRMMAPGNGLYHRWLLGKMKQEMAAAAPATDQHWVEAAQQAPTLWDFDDRVVGPWNGWRGAAEYYAVNSALGFLDRIAVPALVIHALDDPWIPAAAYEGYAWAGNPLLTPLLPRQGGHVGFHGRGGVWADQCLALFLRDLFGDVR